MIIDKNNSREVTLGNGSVLMGIGTINGKEIAYFIHEHTHPSPVVGEYNNEFAGEKAEDLQKIRENLRKDCEVESEHI